MSGPLVLSKYIVDFPPAVTYSNSQAINDQWCHLNMQLKRFIDKILRNRDRAVPLLDTSGSKTVIKSCLDRITTAWTEMQPVIAEAKEMVNARNKGCVENFHAEIENEVENSVDTINEHLETRQHELTSVGSPRDIARQMISTPKPPAAKTVRIQETTGVSHEEHETRDEPTYDQSHYTDPDDETYSEASESETSVAQAVANAFGGMGKTLEQLVLNSELPSEPAFIFDGSPWQYLRFVRSFDEKIGNREYSDNKKMSQLILATRGKAREAIETYQGMQDGYADARRLLRERFGQPYQIVRACIQRLTQNQRLKASDSEGLRKFADRLRADYKLLQEMNMLTEADTQSTLRAIFDQLPAGMQSRWVEKVNTLESDGRSPRFRDLVEFVEVQVKRVDHPVFQVVSSSTTDRDRRPGQRSDSRPQPTPVDRSRPRTSMFSTQQGATADRHPTPRPAPNFSQQERFGPPQQSYSDRSSNFIRPTDTGSSAQSRPFQPSRGNQHADRGPRPAETCVYCNRQHRTIECPVLELQERATRREFAMTNNLCLACGGPHMIRTCDRRNEPCANRDCKGRHHRIFCSTAAATRTVPSSAPSGNADARSSAVPPHTNASIQSRSRLDTPRVLLRVVPVRVTSKTGTSLTTFALLDGGSTTTLMSRALADKLGARGIPDQVSFDTLLSSSQSVDVEVIDCQIAALPGRGDEAPINIQDVEIVPQLHIDARYIQDDVDLSRWSHLRHLSTAADVNMKAVTMCIGQDNPRTQVISDTRYGTDVGNEPYAVKTPFGWTVAGPTSRAPQPVIAHIGKMDNVLGQTPECCSESYPEVRHDLIRLEDALHRLWNEERHGFASDNSKTMSEEDKQALAILRQTTKVENGRYSVGMLWRDIQISFPGNYDVAYKCLRHLVKKFADRPEFARMYRETVKGYIDKGYARKLTPVEAARSTPKTSYIPHHGVENINKPGKVRVVQNAASEKHGISLNKMLLHGPDLNNSMVGVLLRFRQGPVALNGDIAEMFHQVLVPEEDSEALRFLWYEDDQPQDKPPSVYKMTRHIFGAADSPCVCVHAIQQCARDYSELYDSDTISTVLNNFYVDDVLKALPTIESAVRLANQLISLLRRGGFSLTKFVSNQPDVLAALPPELVAPACREIFVDFESPASFQRALGIKWNVGTDTFGVKITAVEKPRTRRGCLSFVCSIPDPQGFVAPVTVVGKKIVQEACRRQLQWDEPLPDDLRLMWEKWLSSLSCLNEFSVPRCYAGLEYPDHVTNIQLHTFCDASETGYGTVSFLRVESADNSVHVSFIMAKSRTAPLRYIGIPRAEFQAATIAARISSLILRELELKVDDTWFWTDSMVTLMYIRNKTKRFKSYIANRKEEILDASSPAQWHHCPTKLNPSDMASRGVSGSKLLRDETWVHGPKFLSLPPDEWPVTPTLRDLSDDDPEVKRKQVIAACMTLSRPLQELLQRYSNWYRLLTAIAWLNKFVQFLRVKVRVKRNADQCIELEQLTVADETRAAESIVRLAQREEFPDEIARLSQAQPVKVASSISQLRPILVNSTLRVGGRLAEAPLSFDTRHPMIIPKNHRISELIIRHFHEKVAHAGVSHTIAAMREYYWLPDARVQVKKVCNSCITCKRLHARKMQQVMANLPASRVTPYQPPFSVTGMDFFGPIMVKRGRSEVKRYGMIATCFATRAVHLELTASMTTDSFINAVRRFIARRGRPSDIWCDNGSNLVGGSRELRRSLNEWNEAQIQKFLRHQQITWHFQTPTASHMSGVWERLVDSVKLALKAILKNALVSDEVAHTVLVEVEAILNSRPITPSSDDPSDFEALTPSHLLLQKPLISLPPGVFQDADQYRRQWRIVQYLSNHFWKRWIKYYLPALQSLSKWRRRRRDVQAGDLVLVAEDNVSRGSWPLARVERVEIGRDGHVRTVHVKTQSGVYKRPIHKLCLLEGARVDPVSVSSTPDSSAGGV